MNQELDAIQIEIARLRSDLIELSTDHLRRINEIYAGIEKVEAQINKL